jgi:hypothetical protein
VLHLLDSSIVDEMGIVRSTTAFAVAVACSLQLAQTARHPERSAAQSKDPDASRLAQTDQTISTNNAFAVVVAVVSVVPQ